MIPNYYALLQLPAEATPEEITGALDALPEALPWHGEARALLLHPDSRLRYDRLLAWVARRADEMNAGSEQIEAAPGGQKRVNPALGREEGAKPATARPRVAGKSAKHRYMELTDIFGEGWDDEG